MKALHQLEIPKRSGHCAHKAEQLVAGMEITSLIFENENQELGRRDFCPTCWQEMQEREAAKPETKGYWKAKIEPKKISPEKSRIGRALELLKEAQGEELFVLCLFLSHARQLALRKEFEEEGATYHLYEILRHDEFITVKAMNLSQAQTENIQKSLAQKLHAA